ncbi:hypothetical protein CLV72_105267 [Allonocardiopsis opalescens]|uniref:Recombinase zinc beta ribbon domain-containing protein n=1 Tax=Allonocardiopsis opalescens TaxID=1144618 RepID=A0A2T0Q290_9ACTN|nr:hypothetical protein CLV72_105267 [Allonocardiopsis opalescens]
MSSKRLLAVKGRRAVVRRPRSTGRVYPLRSLLHCSLCGRRMQGSWNNDQAYYRCTFPNEYATANHIAHPRTLYLREKDVLPPLDDWLARLFDPIHLDATVRMLAASQPESTIDQLTRHAAEEKLAECDAKLEKYRAALETGADPRTVTEWIDEVNADRALAASQLDQQQPDSPASLTAEEITAHLEALGDLTTVIRNADRADKAQLYKHLDLRLTYHPAQRTVRAEANLNPHEQPMYKGTCPRGKPNHSPICRRTSDPHRGPSPGQAVTYGEAFPLVPLGDRHFGATAGVDRHGGVLRPHVRTGASPRRTELAGCAVPAVGGRHDRGVVDGPIGLGPLGPARRLVAVDIADRRQYRFACRQRRGGRAGSVVAGDPRLAELRVGVCVRVADAAVPRACA